MAENRKLCTLIKRKNTIVFKQGNTLVNNLGNLLFLIGIKLAGAIKVTLVIIHIRTKGITLKAGGIVSEEFLKNIIELCKRQYIECYCEYKQHRKTCGNCYYTFVFHKKTP